MGTIPEQNTEIVRASLARFDGRAFARAVEAFDPEIELDVTDLADGYCRGPEAIITYWKGVLATVDFVHADLELLDIDDKVVVLTRMRGQGTTSGVVTDQRFAYIWTLRDGRVVHVRFYAEPSRALEAVGLTRAHVADARAPARDFSARNR